MGVGQRYESQTYEHSRASKYGKHACSEISHKNSILAKKKTKSPTESFLLDLDKNK